MEESKLTIYLAGPISHCNERQKCDWRKTAKAALRKKGYACIDPADHRIDWHPYKEIIDIDKSDVLIANLWLANCYFAHDSPELQRNVTMLHCVENR